MREIVLDTETTGIKPEEGHRLCEIGCVELENHMPTGRTFHVYINPERDMPEGAFRVHGLSEEFLSDKPKFAEVADDFVAFIADAPLVIHNASFDMAFINAELKGANRNPVPMAQAVDTLAIARKKFPGAQNSLDALCRRFNVDNSNRIKHGALLDSELLAEVYLELIGGREPGLMLRGDVDEGTSKDGGVPHVARKQRPAKLKSRITDAEREAHRNFVKTLGDDRLWPEQADTA
ncbi:MAG: DNA polymerase III subunit epsilon [Alphaproteobacteria bacterium]|nr:DNA polymerase III subunit epsilon [Alphaproteobacteria bacterium]MBO6626937.1 DNA polymerase III subunit epsilon [Alphaproteobacteria bacterium]MDF1627704.1 DNA polymerase III subunit epsilon [Parvibaculaceae bacterium]